MANWRMKNQTPDTEKPGPDPKDAIRTELRELASTLRDLDARERVARERQYRLIRQMLDEGATWDQAQFAAEVSRPTVMRAVRDGKRIAAEAEAAAQAQLDAEAANFHRAMGDDPGLTPRP